MLNAQFNIRRNLYGENLYRIVKFCKSEPIFVLAYVFQWHEPDTIDLFESIHHFFFCLLVEKALMIVIATINNSICCEKNNNGLMMETWSPDFAMEVW